MDAPSERLHKVMARAGVASRRVSEKMILAGRVSVNGQVVDTPGLLVHPQEDRISVDGVEISSPVHVYYALHKPVGYISTARDDRQRPKVTDLVPRHPRVFPVGRLDRDTSGLLLLTNDGRLTHALTHPRYEVPKVYLVGTRTPLTARMLKTLSGGVMLTDGYAKPDWVELLHNGEVRICIHLGKKRIVRRMFAQIGASVMRLHRESIAQLSLDGLGTSEWRHLRESEVEALYRCSGVSREPGHSGCGQD